MSGRKMRVNFHQNFIQKNLRLTFSSLEQGENFSNKSLSYKQVQAQKNTIKAGGSTATKMWTGWMDGWIGDTPQTVTTTRAPCGAKN